MIKVQPIVNVLVIIALVFISILLWQVQEQQKSAIADRHSQIQNEVISISKKFHEFEQDQKDMLDAVLESVENTTKGLNKVKADVVRLAGIKTTTEESAKSPPLAEQSKKLTESAIPVAIKEKIDQQFGLLGVNVTSYSSEEFMSSLIDLHLIPYSSPEEVPEEVKEKVEVYHSVFMNKSQLSFAKHNLKRIEYTDQLNRDKKYLEFPIDANLEEIEEKMKELPQKKYSGTITRPYPKLGIKRYYFASFNENPELFAVQTEILEAKNQLFADIYDMGKPYRNSINR